MGNKLCCAQNNANMMKDMKMTQTVVSEKVNNTNVSLILGKVFDEDVDAIVLITNTKLKLGQNDAQNLKFFINLSTFPRRFGGEAIGKELSKILFQESGRLRVGEVVYTHGGEMDFDFILYAILPSFCDSSMLITPQNDNHDENSQPSNSLKENMKNSHNAFQIFMSPVGNSTEQQEKQQIFECLINCLNKASELGVKSLAFPVMEPPSFHLSKSLIATIMIVAIKTFLRENQQLNAVHITISDSPTLQLFKWVLASIVNDGNQHDHPLINQLNSHDSEKQFQQYWGVKSSMQESFQADTEDLIRFGHGFASSVNKSTDVDIKRSL